MTYKLERSDREAATDGGFDEGSVLMNRVEQVPPSRFSLSGLLIGIAILSVCLAFGIYAAIEANFALEAENNLLGYLHTADALNAFVERHRRWPRNEAELREFDGQPAGWPKLQDYALGRSIVAYDFDLSHESLDSPETFRGLRYKEPSFRSTGAVIDDLLATLREVRDAQAAAVVPVDQAARRRGGSGRSRRKHSAGALYEERSRFGAARGIETGAEDSVLLGSARFYHSLVRHCRECLPLLSTYGTRCRAPASASGPCRSLWRCFPSCWLLPSDCIRGLSRSGSCFPRTASI